MLPWSVPSTCTPCRDGTSKAPHLNLRWHPHFICSSKVLCLHMLLFLLAVRHFWNPNSLCMVHVPTAYMESAALTVADCMASQVQMIHRGAFMRNATLHRTFSQSPTVANAVSPQARLWWEFVMNHLRLCVLFVCFSFLLFLLCMSN